MRKDRKHRWSTLLSPGLVAIGSPKTGWWSKFIRRGQLTFSDGTVVYHGILWIKRARYVAQEGNFPRT